MSISKNKFVFSIVFIAGIASVSMWSAGELKKNNENTGIYLDTLKNEVVLAYVNDFPSFYYSNIHTHVCENCECKEIDITIYWDLEGNYLRFDQPDGAMLTKRGHVPFTKEDYERLDEIVRGEDPRYNGDKQGEGESSETKVLLSKSEIVDGVSGATLPAFQNRFVSGALYTTYTVWTLANSRKVLMRDHTRNHLLVPEYFNYFFGNPRLGCRRMLVEKWGEKAGKNGFANVLMSILDTTENTENASWCMDQLSLEDINLDTVAHSLDRLWTTTRSDKIRREILSKWKDVDMRPESVRLLPSAFQEHPEVFDQILKTLQLWILSTRLISMSLLYY